MRLTKILLTAVYGALADAGFLQQILENQISTVRRLTVNALDDNGLLA